MRAPGAVSGGDGPDVGDGDDGANEDGSDGSTAKFDASGTADIIELELSAARILEPAPRSARVVFVVDASRSQDETGVASQLALIRGYLAHVPDARFEVVVYRRHPQRLFGAFVPARDAARALAGVAPAMLRPGNGSHLDRGLLAAVDAVRSDRAGRSGTGAHPVRIVAFTDDRNRRAFTAEIAAGALARLTDGGASRDAVVHILRTTQRGGGNYEFSRDDEHELAPVAERTGGMFGRVQGDDAATAAAAMLGLVRPIQIDGLTLEVDGFALGGNDQDEDEDDRGDDPDDAEWAAERRRARIAEAFAVPDVFAEGRGYRRMLVVADSPRQVTVRGKIWGRPWKRTVAVHAGRSARLPGLVFGHTAWSDLPKTWLERIAREAGVVSPVTSLLARDGRDDPVSFPPPEILRGGISGYASCGCGGSASIGTTCGGYGFLGAIDRAHKSVLLAAMLRPRIAACALAAGLDQPPPVALTVETTREEIVDVTPLEAPAAIRECAVDAAWSLVLDARFYEGRGAYRVTVR